MSDGTQRFRFAHEFAHLGLWEWDVQTNKAYLSQQWKQQLGYSDEDFDNQEYSWIELIHPDDRAEVDRASARCFEGGHSVFEAEFRLRRKDGDYLKVYTRADLLRDQNGTPTRMLGCNLDVARLKRADDTLRDILGSVSSVTDLKYFGRLANFLTEVCGVDYALIAELDSATRESASSIAFSHNGKLISNLTYDLKDTSCNDLWQSDGVRFIAKGLQKLYPKDLKLVGLKINCCIGIPLWASTGEPIGILALYDENSIPDPEHAKMLLQVTGARTGAELQRIKAESTLRESEKRLTRIAATMPHALYVYNLATQETEFQNRSVGLELGYTDKEMDGFGTDVLGYLLHPQDKAKLPDLLTRWDSAIEGEVYETEYRMRHKSGEWRWYLGRDSVYERDADGRVQSIVGTAQDITHRIKAEKERRMLESQMQHSQKLESLGILAGGVAHDFNNLLTSILNYSTLALGSTSPDSQTSTYIKEIITGAKSAAELTGQLLAYSGKGSVVANPIDLSSLVSETLRLLQLSISEKVTLEVDLDSNLPQCHGDVGQLRQVIMNLVMNASEAIGDEEGVIRISTQVCSTDDLPLYGDSATKIRKCGHHARLIISDSGCGMDEATRQKLFDPFFTTKSLGRGLGMSAVQGIIKGHEGVINVESSPTQGTTVRVCLPIDDSVTDSQTDESTSASAWEQTQTILIADDDRAVLESTVLLLKTAGFEVIAAHDGKEAIEKFRDLSNEIELVLLDVKMPYMDGPQVFQELKSIRDDVQVIFMSGYSDHSIDSNQLENHVAGFIHKPFQLDELMDELTKVQTTTKQHATQTNEADPPR